MAAEAAGIPSVSIVCEGFEGQATATGRGHGFDDLPLAVTVGHVDAQSTDTMIANFVSSTVPQIIDGLTGATVSDGAAGEEPAALDVVVSGGIDAVTDHFLAQVFTQCVDQVLVTVATRKGDDAKFHVVRMIGLRSVKIGNYWG